MQVTTTASSRRAARAPARELPLFDKADAAPAPPRSRAGRGRAGRGREETAMSPAAEQHREAARRLARAIRRAPGRAQQTRLGGLVCEHLIAMLRAQERLRDDGAETGNRRGA